MATSFSLIGCGRIGERHAELIFASGNLIAVCDTNFSKAEKLAKKFNVRAFKSLDELLLDKRKSDWGVVCTPNGLHAQHSIQLLNSGVNVLCEKPMAISLSDCRDMLNAAAKNRKQLFVVKQNRFNPSLLQLKDALDSGRLGKIYSLQISCFWNRNESYYNDSWRGTKALDGGTLFTQFSHFIDLLYWLFGEVKKTAAFLTNANHKGMIEFEDTGAVIFEMENGIIGTLNYTVNAYEKNMEGSITVFGEKGTVKIGGEYLNRVEYQNMKDFQFESVGGTPGPNNYGTYQGSMSNHDKVYINLLQYLAGREESYVNANDGMKTVEIIEKIYHSAISVS